MYQYNRDTKLDRGDQRLYYYNTILLSWLISGEKGGCPLWRFCHFLSLFISKKCRNPALLRGMQQNIKPGRSKHCMIERTQSLRIFFSPAYSQPPESVRKLSLTQGQKIQYGALANSVSDPYSLNPDPDKNFHSDPDPERPRIRIRTISLHYLKRN